MSDNGDELVGGAENEGENHVRPPDQLPPAGNPPVTEGQQTLNSALNTCTNSRTNLHTNPRFSFLFREISFFAFLELKWTKSYRDLFVDLYEDGWMVYFRMDTYIGE
jgi:hypothetical protein